MPIDTSLPPYFDDFDGQRNYVSVLYKASFPVQARELNTMQSIQDDQRRLFADHVFKDGACVSGPPPKQNICRYVIIDSASSYDNQKPKIEMLGSGIDIQGETSLIKAQIVHAAFVSGAYVLYIKYTSGSPVDPGTTEFLAGETLSIPLEGMPDYKVEVATDEYVAELGLERCGKGTLWEIPESVYYINGFFLNVQYSVVLVEPFTVNKDEYTLGFDVIEQIITCAEDETLYDNALGYPNYSAPGADRKQMQLLPMKRGLDAGESDHFIVLARVESGNVVYIKSRTDYARLMDTLAERTYDESGNYTVRPFSLKIFEHLKRDVNDPKGYFLKERGGREDQILAVLSPGKAYVKGYLVERISETKLALDKARDVKQERNVYKRFDECSYILVTLNENSAHKPIRTNSTQDDGNGDYARLFTGEMENGQPSGTEIGRLKVFDTLLDSIQGDKKVYRLYIADIEMFNNEPFSRVKTIYHGGEVIFSAAPFGTPEQASPFTVNGNNPYLMYLGKDNIKTLRDVDNSSVRSLSLTVRKTFHDTIESNGKVVFTAGDGEYFESLNYNSTIAGIIEKSGGVVTMLETAPSIIEVTGNTITLNCGTEHAGKKAFCVHNVVISNLYERDKTFATKTEDSIPLRNGKLELSVPDVLRIKRVDAVSTTDTTQVVDVTDMFVLHNDIGQFEYKNAYLTAATNIPNADKLAFNVEFDYLAHSPGGYVFTVDSYWQPINDNEIDFTYADIPTVTIDGTTRHLSDYLDFRSCKEYIPAIGGMISSDMTYYLPRIDYIVINKDGEIFQKKGISADKPRPPQLVDGDEMAIYRIYLSPYGFDCYKDCASSFIENKRFTMRDIGRIESRVSQLEYTTTLNLLEQELQTMSVKDENGLDRFKNGYVADNFKTLAAGDIDSGEFRATLFSDVEELRPTRDKCFCKMGVNMEKSQREGPVKQVCDVVMIDYDVVPLFTQPYASKWMSVNPYYVFEQEGVIELTPDHDTWTTREDAGSEKLSTTYLDVVDERDIKELDIRPTIRRSVGVRDSRAGTTVTTGEQMWDVERTLLRSDVERDVVNSIVTDASLSPYMRPNDIRFHATGMRPNMRVYMFFDGEPVTEFCTIGNGPEPEEKFVTDGQGTIDGVFRIPEQRFFAGQKTFRITNHPEDSRDPDMLLTSAEAKYWSQGLNISVKDTYKEFVTRHWRESLSLYSAVVITSYYWNSDPVAETFSVEKPCFVAAASVYFREVAEDDKMFFMILGTENGYPCMEKELGVKYFTSKDCKVSEDATEPTTIHFDKPIYLEGGKEYAFVVGGNNPGSFVWVARLGQKDVTQGNVIVTQPNLGSLFKSQNKSTWTPEQYEDLKFDLYRCDFKSNEMTVVLENRENESVQTKLNPFETQNGSAFVRVHSPNHGMVAGDRTSFRKTTNDFHDEGTVIKNTPLRVEVFSGKLPYGEWLEDVDGQAGKSVHAGHMVSDSGSGDIVRYIQEMDENGKPTNFYTVYLKNVRGCFRSGEPFEVYAVQTNQNNLLIVKDGYEVVQLRHNQYEGCRGKIATDWETGLYNGIPVAELTSNDLDVYTVDSVDSYIVQCDTPASVNGLTGGIIEMNENKRVDSFRVDGLFDKNEYEVSWNVHLRGHSVNGLFVGTDYIGLPLVETELGDLNYLDKPAKLANDINETLRPDGEYKKSVTLTGKFKIEGDLVGWVSPVVYANTYQFEGYTNHIEYLDGEYARHEPNNISEFIPETHSSDGIEVFKYLTKPITLANPASDLKVLVDVKQEQYSDFDIYVRFLHPWEYNDIHEKEWIKIENTWKQFGGPEYREVEVQVSRNNPELQLQEFEQFQVKIVGRSKNTAKPIVFKRFRAIAVT